MHTCSEKDRIGNVDLVNARQHRDYQNYFTPIKLSKLNLVVILPDGTKTTDYEGFYEFEITVLKDSFSKR